MPIALSIIAVAFVLFGIGVFFIPTVTGWTHRPKAKAAIARPAIALTSPRSSSVQFGCDLPGVRAGRFYKSDSRFVHAANSSARLG